MRQMKITYALLVLVFLCPASYGQRAPELEALSSPWDFGRVRKGDIKEKSFTLRNAGDEKVVIENVSSCCGYGVTDVSRWEISPGQESKIKVSCDASRKEPGEDKNKVSIRSNDPDNPTLTVPVTAVIIP
jgi:hypothetical protein